METAGQRLKRARERLELRYREVSEASMRIARRQGNSEYAIALSRLSDIENKGTVPNIYRLYSLCAIYRLDMREVMRWYGVQPEDAVADVIEMPLSATHLADFADLIPAPRQPDPMEMEGDPSRTRFLNHIHRWGKISAGRLPGFDSQHYRYGYVGLDDWSMHPILEPGSLVMIDTRRQKIVSDGWTNERDRPIYFLEQRDGYRCGWCTLTKETLVLQPHPASKACAVVYRYPEEIEVVGEIVGTAMLLSSRIHRRDRSSVVRESQQSIR